MLLRKWTKSRACLELAAGFIYGSLATFCLLYLFNQPLVQYALYPPTSYTNRNSVEYSVDSVKISDDVTTLSKEKRRKLFMDEIFPKTEREWEHRLRPDSKDIPGTFKAEMNMKTIVHQVILPEEFDGGGEEFYFLENVIKQLPLTAHWYYFGSTVLSDKSLHTLEHYLNRFDETLTFTSFSLNHHHSKACNERAGYVLSLTIIKSLLALKPPGDTVSKILSNINIGPKQQCTHRINLNKVQELVEFDPASIITRMNQKLSKVGMVGNGRLSLGQQYISAVELQGSKFYQQGRSDEVFNCIGKYKFNRQYDSASLPPISPQIRVPATVDSEVEYFLIIPFTKHSTRPKIMMLFQRLDEGIFSQALHSPQFAQLSILLVLPIIPEFENNYITAVLTPYGMKYGKIIIKWLHVDPELEVQESLQLAITKLVGIESFLGRDEKLVCSLPSSIGIAGAFFDRVAANTEKGKLIYWPGITDHQSLRTFYNANFFCSHGSDITGSNIKDRDTDLNIWKSADPSLYMV